MNAPKRRYVEPFLGGGAVLLGLRNYGESKPFLRWAGGKRRLFGLISERLQPYHVKDYLVADVNADLVAAWQAVRDSEGEVVRWLRDYWPTCTDDYYTVRKMTIESDRCMAQGARQIYLNLFAFNGLNRQNKRGEFNAPCDKARIVSVKLDTVAANLRAVSKLLVGVDIVCADFSTTLSRCGDGDVIYVDSPYLPEAATKTAFVNYSASSRDWSKPDAHVHVALACADAVERGARVVISNSMAAKPIYDKLLSKLPGYRVDVVRARRSVSCRRDGRGVVDEILVTVGE